jgi:hypothetical protein
VNRAVLNLGVRPQAIKRTPWPPADSAICKLVSFSCYESLHSVSVLFVVSVPFAPQCSTSHTIAAAIAPIAIQSKVKRSSFRVFSCRVGGRLPMLRKVRLSGVRVRLGFMLFLFLWGGLSCFVAGVFFKPLVA